MAECLHLNAANAIILSMKDTLIKHCHNLLVTYAVGIVLAGVVYLYAGLLAPVAFSAQTTQFASSLQSFFYKLQPAWLYYCLGFMLFVFADFALIMTGACLGKLYREHSPYAQWVFICFSVGGLMSLAIDLASFCQWQIIGMYSAKMATTSLPALWTGFLLVQTVGLWASALWFIVMAIGVSSILVITKENTNYSARWRQFTVLLIALLLLCAGALALMVFTSIQAPALVLFLLVNLLIAPIWCVWFAKSLAAKPASD